MENVESRAILPEKEVGRGSVGGKWTTGKERGGTGGGSLEGVDATLRYRLQMIAFTRTVAGEMAGAQAVGWSRDTAATTGVMLSRRKGYVGRVIQNIGCKLCALQMDGYRIRAYFKRCRKVESAELLGRIGWEGAPVKIWVEGNVES